MATTKKTETDVQITEKERTVTPEEYMNQKVEFEAFYDGKYYKDPISVIVNGKRYMIQRGVKVMIPRFVAEVLENADKQTRKAANQQRDLQTQFERDTEHYMNG